MQSLHHLIRREVTAAWRHRWIAVATAWLVCLGGWAGVIVIPNQFESSARLYVDADAVLTPLLHGIALDSGVTGQLDILQRTLLSRPNLEKVIAKTDLDLRIRGPADLESLVARLGTAIRIMPQTRNLFSISYRDSSARLSYDVVRTMLAMFVESKTGINRSEMDNARTFLGQQIANYEKQLREAEKKRAEFRTRYVDLLPNDQNGVSGLEQARTAVRQLQGSLSDAQASREMLTHELQATPPLIATEQEGGGGPGGNARLAEAERNLSELRLRYTEHHPDVVQARKLVEDIRSGRGGGAAADAPRSAGPRSRSVPNPIYEQFKVKLVQTDADIASLTRRLGEAQRERDRLDEVARGAPGLQAEYLNLNRDYEVVRKNYDELLSRREEMRIGSAAESDADKIKIQIVDPPQVPQIPVSPNRFLLTTGVLLAGIGAGCGLAVLLVQFDRSFHSIDDLRSLNLPVIGGVSLLAPPSSRGRAAAFASFAAAMLLLGAVYAGLVTRVLHLSMLS